MSKFFSKKFENLVPYTPGEQPQDKKYIKLNTNESPFPPSPLAQRFAREEAGDLQLYSDPDCRRLTQTAADYWEIGTDEIVFTNGSDDILNFAMTAFCDDECPAVFADITYSFYPVIADLNRIPTKVIPLNEDFTIDVDKFINVGGTVFLANPNATTGIALPLSEIERIVAGNPDNVVVVDEAYVDFGGESAIGLINKYPNLLVTGTFSKSRSLAGGRLGYGIACKELISDLNSLRFSTNPYNINRMTMAAGIGAIIDERYFKECTEEIIATRAWTVEELKKLGFSLTDSSANFVLADAPKESGLSGEYLYKELKNRGILVRFFGKKRIENCLRITIGSREQMQALIAELKSILQGE